jgi:hypothetical protein
MDDKEIEREILDCDLLISELNPMAGSYGHGNEPSGFTKIRGIF